MILHGGEWDGISPPQNQQYPPLQVIGSSQECTASWTRNPHEALKDEFQKQFFRHGVEDVFAKKIGDLLHEEEHIMYEWSVVGCDACTLIVLVARFAVAAFAASGEEQPHKHFLYSGISGCRTCSL